MSPQQLSGESASASDDIYSLGATLYELLSSKPPFYSGDITYQVLHVTPRPVSAQRSHLSEGKQGFEAIPLQMQAGIARCLEKSPELRPRSAEEAVSEILGESMTTVRVSPVAPLSQVQLTKRKNVALLPAIGVLSLILLLLIGAGLYAFVINSRHAEKSEALPILAEHSPVPTPTPESAAKSEQSGAQDPTLKEALASIGSEDTSPDPSPAASVAAVPTQPLQETPAVQGLISATDDRGTASSDAGPSASAQPVDFNYFHDQLAPFGTWINVNGSMYWHPDQAINSNPDWRPYYDMGQWVQTENGMYWQSDYTWGDIPFHYGRWVQDPNYGWIWSPDYTWGPAWVFWRQSDAYGGAIGWAPLPVGAIFANGILMFNGMAADQNCDFGLGESAFVFVGYNHFHESFFRMRGHEWAYHIPPSQLHGFYKSSFVKNDFHQDGSGRFVNGGIGLNRINQLTHGQVAKSAFEGRTPVGDRNQLAETRSKLITEQHHVPTSVSAENTEHRIAKPLSVERTSESGHEPVRPVSVSKVFRPELPRKSVQQPQVVTTPQTQKKK